MCFILLTAGLFKSFQSAAQCTIALNNGKSITLKFTPVAIVTPSACNGWGYNYDYKIQYTATVNGSVTFWHVGATFESGTANSFSFSMTNANIAAGSGTFTTNNNQGRYANDCATVTPASLNPRNLVITISSSEGSFTTNCAFAAAAGSSSNSTATTGGTAPLPVKLLSFDGAINNNNKVDLTWVTATETDNAFFILERSANAQTWEAITKMDGAGTTHSNTTYNYTDEVPAAGMNYYRLKQVDANGTVAYSRTLAVKANEGREQAISLYPNPATGDDLHFVGLGNAADWSIKVINTSSATVYQGMLSADQVQLPGLTAGIYFVQLHNSKTGAVQSLKMIRK